MHVRGLSTRPSGTWCRRASWSVRIRILLSPLDSDSESEHAAPVAAARHTHITHRTSHPLESTANSRQQPYTPLVYSVERRAHVAHHTMPHPHSTARAAPLPPATATCHLSAAHSGSYGMLRQIRRTHAAFDTHGTKLHHCSLHPPASFGRWIARGRLAQRVNGTLAALRAAATHSSELPARAPKAKAAAPWHVSRYKQAASSRGQGRGGQLLLTAPFRDQFALA
jgi:hypothetical protein